MPLLCRLLTVPGTALSEDNIGMPEPIFSLDWPGTAATCVRRQLVELPMKLLLLSRARVTPVRLEPADTC